MKRLYFSAKKQIFGNQAYPSDEKSRFCGRQMKFMLNKFVKMLENRIFPIKYRGKVSVDLPFFWKSSFYIFGDNQVHKLLRLLRNIWKKLFEVLREKAPILTVNLRTRPNENYPCKVDWLATTRPKYNVANSTQAQKQRCQVPKCPSRL